MGSWPCSAEHTGSLEMDNSLQLQNGLPVAQISLVLSLSVPSLKALTLPGCNTWHVGEIFTFSATHVVRTLKSGWLELPATPWLHGRQAARFIGHGQNVCKSQMQARIPGGATVKIAFSVHIPFKASHSKPILSYQPWPRTPCHNTNLKGSLKGRRVPSPNSIGAMMLEMWQQEAKHKRANSDNRQTTYLVQRLLN